MRLLLAIVAAAVAAIVAFVTLFAACAGMAWIFLFGDNPWPSWSGAALIVPPAAGALFVGYLVFRVVSGGQPVP
jgi:hypothetical protein